MTKEELAKKKGLSVKKTDQTAAETLITTKKNEDIQNTPTMKEVQPKKKSISKAGRPKGKPSTKISLNVPDEYLAEIKIAAGINHKGNTSSYIISLIEEDMRKNGRLYQQIKDLKK